MGIDRHDAITIAQAFHRHYEELAPSFGYKTRDASAVPWDEVPESNRTLMIATVERVLDEMFLPVGAAMYDADGWHVAFHSMVPAPVVVPADGPKPLGVPVLILHGPNAETITPNDSFDPQGSYDLDAAEAAGRAAGLADRADDDAD